jgi:amidohydrolase
MNETANMLEKAQEISHHIVGWRREIHTHPEIAFQEVCTAARIAEILGQLGYRVTTGIGKTGVVGEIGEGGLCVAIRADIDALPLQEETGLPFASQVDGMMHACGHDAHAAMGLGAAWLLSRAPLPGRVRFLFQPTEEDSDHEGKSGAPRMIEDGAIEGVDAIFAQHVDPMLSTGKIAIGEGATSAGVDTFFITIKADGGHGAAPHLTVDPIFVSGHVILALNGIVSRRIHPYEPAVISVCSIHGGQASNVIPSTVELTGTIRFMNDEVQKTLHREIEKSLSIVSSLGGEYDLRIEIGYPPSYNDPQMAALVRSQAAALIGEENLALPQRTMGAEDFGYFMQHAPGAMFSLGVKGERNDHLHSPTFVLDEAALPLGAALLAQSALRFLEGGGSGRG